MNKTLEEWIKFYEKKTKGKFERDKRFELFFVPEKGFAEVMDTGKMLWVNQMCGEFKFWREFVENLSCRFGYKVAGTFCIRNIEAYIRLAGFEVIEWDSYEEGRFYLCIDKKTNQKGRAAPSGENTYYVTWEVTPNATTERELYGFKLPLYGFER